MKLENFKAKGNGLEFTLKDASVAFANAIRKAILTEIPCMAVDSIDLYENSSVMFDEYVAHRIGMVPIETPKPYVDKPREVIFTLEAEGPKTVYSKEMKSSDPKVKPVYDTMPIIKLGDKQRIRLEAKAIIGKAKDHAKWQAGTAHYIMAPEIKIDSRKCNQCKACVKACPKNIIKLADGKIKVSNPDECIECKECIKACEKDAISISFSKTDFKFTIESFGGMSAKEMFDYALQALKEKAESLEQELK